MDKIQLSDIFSIEYLDIVTKYKDRIQKVLSEYDIVIFMARKAICFYKALVSNGEVAPNDNCVVLSSRVLTYNVIAEFMGKKVAIIDDVVVRGKSLLHAKDLLENYNIKVDIYFVACETAFAETIAIYDCIHSPFVYLSDMNIYQLSNYITEYIEASMIPYNIDQPIYTISFANSIEYDSMFLNKNHISVITDGLQKKHGIKNLLVHFNSHILKNIFGNDFETENTYIKIRFLYNIKDLRLLAIPFVLLPEISREKLDEVFSNLFGDHYDDYIFHDNKREEYENKLKVLQYVLSDILFNDYSKMLELKYIKKDLTNEHMHFSKELIDAAIAPTMASISLDLSYCIQTSGFDSYFSFDSILSDAYDYIFDSTISNECFLNAEGEIIAQRIITFSGIATYIKQVDGLFRKHAVSSVIDILIDKGILIPSIVHTKDNNIVRGYKCGEIYNLTKRGIDLFAYMLDKYADVKIGKPLDKVELEKLCVLFFKNIAYKNRLFSSSKTFDDDCFTICYSKFGPRVSNCNKKYSVDSNSALASLLVERGQVQLDNDKYTIAIASTPLDKRWKIIAENFAYSYFNLSKCFENRGVQHQYVHTYNEFLTLLSIGPDSKNKMFSLMAELYLLMRIDMNNSLSSILNQMDHYSPKRSPLDKSIYQGIMDGINSGMWKYSCFCDSSLMDSIFANSGRIQSDVRYIMEDYFSNINENDENPVYIELVEKCGSLLYEIAFLFNFAHRRVFGTQNSELHRAFSSYIFYDSRFDSMRKGIKRICETNPEEEIVNSFRTLKKRAQALINQCDLCIEDAALTSINIHDDVWVLFHPEYYPIHCGLELNVHSSKENDLIQKCVFLQYDKNKDFESQLTEIVDRYTDQKLGFSLLFVDIENLYEGIFESYRTATGDYFKELTRQLIIKSNYMVDISANKVLICTRKDIDAKNDIYFSEYILKFDTYGEVLDGYKFCQYILIKKEQSTMKDNNSGPVTNINAPINVYGGVLAAVGTGNTVNIDKDSVNDFFEEIKKINAEMLKDDPNVTELVQEIKDEAEKKNSEGVLDRLKKLAINVGSSVFSKLVSSLIIEVMKAKGYFPF